MKKQFLKIYFRFKKPVLAAVGKRKDLSFRMTRFLARNASLPDMFVLPLKEEVVSFIGAAEKTLLCFQNKKEAKKAEKIIKGAQKKEKIFLIARRNKKKHIKHSCPNLTFGFDKAAAVSASDIKTKKGATNFKINFKGKTVPVWLKGEWSREEMSSALLAFTTGVKAGANLIRLTRTLRNFDKGE